MMKKRIKRLLRLRNSSGFTLVEVIVACALLGILILGIMGFVTPILSSVREKEKNARALMLSEVLNTYIFSELQYAYYVATITGAATQETTIVAGNPPAVYPLTYSGSEFPKAKDKNLGLSTLHERFKKLGSDDYEIRCIGIRWLGEAVTHEKKLMVTHEKVKWDENKIWLDTSKQKLLFEDCFYDGLYPIVRFENYSNQYHLDADKRDDTENIASGLGLFVDVYTKPDCYNTKAEVREKALLTWSGESYIGFTNIKNTLDDKTQSNEIVPNIQVNTYAAALGKDSSAAYTSDGEKYYYPESFIFYIAYKSVANG